jgi:hypothetical protein
MPVTIATADAPKLLKNILAKFDGQAIAGWESDGDSFSLAAPQKSGKVWVRPFPQAGQLVLGLVPAEGQEMSKELFAVYCGRLVEMLLTHFSDLISSAQVSAGITYPDLMHWTGESQHAPRGN